MSDTTVAIPTDMNALLSEPQAAALMGLSRFTLRNKRLEGHGPRHIRIGRNVRYRRVDLEVFIEQHAQVA